MTPNHATAFAAEGPLNAAQVMVMAFVGNDPKFLDYRAPHANRAPPPRPHFPRHLRRRPGLLKGLRP